ncbi:MAG: hypothetical protein A3H96_16540 [Acidobacteria bacterium RIFCSPLOWO2_02_FULL_67_36]|nr:MAG: hypothetical protein A3H96_16540 [Acidobacteria bacterium RIFCSPLOWO2_02_FULL_67_36]OFW20772.1 MAG: hypothetical protein A3G21_22740 [Acidobacteria bacterium RIFCSPLOWO2_12_FULL_66_21]
MSRRAWALLVAAVIVGAVVFRMSGGRILAKQYEYEEDVTLSLDGSATLIVNASVASLSALRGLDISPAARVDLAVRDRIRAAYQSPVTTVLRVSPPWRRAGRQFVQIRVSTTDIRRLPEAAPFSWSRYSLGAANGHHVFHQVVGPSALRPGTLQNVGWYGGELVAFRLHLPSKIISHNSRDVDTDQTLKTGRGNILRWEQHLADRLDGKPVDVLVELESQSILYRTLWLFAGAFLAAVALLAFLIWMTIRKGADEETTTSAP